MKNPKLFIDAIDTLLYSWGSDAPQEAYWAANELLDWCEKEYGIKLSGRLGDETDEDYDEKDEGAKSEDELLLEELAAKLKEISKKTK